MISMMIEKFFETFWVVVTFDYFPIICCSNFILHHSNLYFASTFPGKQDSSMKSEKRNEKFDKIFRNLVPRLSKWRLQKSTKHKRDSSESEDGSTSGASPVKSRITSPMTSLSPDSSYPRRRRGKVLKAGRTSTPKLCESAPIESVLFI